MRRRRHRDRWREGFRETFLVLFTRRGDASALRRLGFLLSELYINANPRWWPRLKEDELYALLGAVVRDLRHLCAVLESAGGVRRPYGGQADAVAIFASRQAEELEEIADTIEGAMADPDRAGERLDAILNAAVVCTPGAAP